MVRSGIAGNMAILSAGSIVRPGKMVEYTLPEKALPHSMTPDRDGNIWYTGNGNGTVGKLEPKPA